ncbi:MAG: class I SAM-dependent methyltransferase [Candidatus Korarchaeota archaeon]|nr:class I SAM-dependent methyltransferase [Candidatus Korarchaeota archaeon]NIU83933.1 class I SAM-dependent methyltransferase [Candidatus Thorarchaeota archaeon]NIW14061.1 class I SAM-dependent methyltransferase [Candidatus Thorarchaeota archaeon]NIW52171.1 class I SAM-dependent methyltransferase [Candidatus Korarchaeota archaeon]
MYWKSDELDILEGILERIKHELEPLHQKDILVLCSNEGDVVFRLAEGSSGTGMIIGLELNENKLKRSRKKAKKKGIENKVRFAKPKIDRLAYPNETFDAIVSEFIVYPATEITKIGQPEMARVLKRGGKIVQTEVIVKKEIDEDTKRALQEIGVEYVCESSKDNFRRWMSNAGFVNIKIDDISKMIRPIWKKRDDGEKKGYEILLDHPELKIGDGILYLFMSAEKSELS